jgi:hypothetical protein
LLNDVAELLGVQERLEPNLHPAELVERLDIILSGAQRFIVQFDPAVLALNVRDRKRTLRTLGYHIFRIAQCFVAVAAKDVSGLRYEALTAEPPADVVTTADIARFGEDVRTMVRQWWAAQGDGSEGEVLTTYYGPQTVHELLERTTWHCGQHVRQLMALLEQDYGKALDGGAVPASVFEGLPMPREAWDG